MTWVALALVATLAATVLAFAGLLRADRRSTARERDLILNQLLNAVGKPWQPAPADEPAPRPAAEVYESGRFTASPEQFPPDE